VLTPPFRLASRANLIRPSCSQEPLQIGVLMKFKERFCGPLPSLKLSFLVKIIRLRITNVQKVLTIQKSRFQVNACDTKQAHSVGKIQLKSPSNSAERKTSSKIRRCTYPKKEVTQVTATDKTRHAYFSAQPSPKGR